MSERTAQDGGSIFVFVPTTDNAVPVPDRPGIAFLYYEDGTGFMVREYGKSAVTLYAFLGIDTTTQAATASAISTALGGVTMKSGVADPTAGGGVVATIPALYVRTSDGTLWSKTGAGATQWTKQT